MDFKCLSVKCELRLFLSPQLNNKNKKPNFFAFPAAGAHTNPCFETN